MECVDGINGKSHVYGIIGNPIEHSFSPILQNSIGKALGDNMVYVPFCVTPGEVKKAIDGAYALGFYGFNVTIPHKEEVMEALCDIDPLAAQIGAVNTLKRVEGGYKGYNTDIIGLERCFAAQGLEIKNKTVVILGSGGAAHAAVILAASKGADKLYIINRTVKRAEELKEQVEKYYTLPVSVLTFDRILEIPSPDLVINTTSVGMGGETMSPVENTVFWEKVKAVVDIIYIPWETQLLKDAAQKGCKTVNGFDMLMYQGIASYEIWTGRKLSDTFWEMARKAMTAYYKKSMVLLT